MDKLTRPNQAAMTTQSMKVAQRSLLRNVMLWMSLGMGVTCVTSLMTISNQWLMQLITSSPMVLIVLFIGEIGLVFFLSARIMHLKPQTAMFSFIIYSVLNGITLSLIFIIYTGASIVGTFLITAATFGAMSLYGLSTKTDLSKMGSYLIMGLFGIIIASVVNIFLKSSGLYWLISLGGVILFSALTAYDTQKIKKWGLSASSPEDYFRLSILGALRLYLDFINLFLFLLRFMGRSRN